MSSSRYFVARKKYRTPRKKMGAITTIAQRYDEFPIRRPITEKPVPARAISPARAKAVDRISGGATTAVIALNPGVTNANTIIAVQMQIAASHRVGATPSTA